MRVQREPLLKILESVTPGLSSRETIEQSSCLVFTGGRVITFNEEILCSRKSPLDFEGAVRAKPLLDLLSKLPDEEIELMQAEGVMRVKGKGRKSEIRMESEVMLPMDTVEIPENWRQLDLAFEEGVSLVHDCASTNTAEFILTCIHIHPEYLEACDRFQIARFPMKTGIDTPILVRAASMRKIVGYSMAEVSETAGWIHFRNAEGLTLSLRRFLDEYKSLDKFVSSEGTTPITLPGGLEEVVARAEIFSGENAVGNHVTVDLKPDNIIIEGDGASGWFKEQKSVVYSGNPVRFTIAPKLLVAVTKRSNECGVGEGRLFIDTGVFKYVTCTTLPDVKAQR